MPDPPHIAAHVAQPLETDGDARARLYEAKDNGVAGMFRELEAVEAQHRQR